MADNKYSSPVLDGILPQLENLTDEERQAIAEKYHSEFDDAKNNANELLPWQGKALENFGKPMPQVSADEMAAQAKFAQGGVPIGQMGPPKPNAEDLAQRRVTSEPLNKLVSLRTKTPITMPAQGGPIEGGNYKAPTVADLLAKLNQPDPEMESAQANRNQLQLFSMLGKAGNTILGAQTHTKPNNEVYDDMAKNAGQGISDIQSRQVMQSEKLKQHDMASKLVGEQIKQDPASDISRTYRSMAEEMTGRKLPEGMSAADLEKISPVFEKMFAAKQAQLDRSVKMAEVNALRERGIDSRIENQANSRWDKATKGFGDQIELAKRSEEFLDNISSGKIKSSKNVRSQLSADISRLLLGAQQTALGDREKSEVLTAYGKAQDALAYISGSPNDSIPAAYIDQLKAEVKLLKKKYLDAYKRKKNELVSGTQYQVGKDVFNNRYSSQMSDQGIDPESLDSSSLDNPGGYEPDVVDYAKEHGISPETAQAIKAERSKGVK